MSHQYEIRLQGHLGSQWSQWFDSLVIRQEHDETVLTGPIVDQAALHGILAKIRDIGIPLLALRQLHEPHTTQEMDRQEQDP